jgi:glycerol-3-phosphate dehydrogenase (NAD(P)+)
MSALVVIGAGSWGTALAISFARSGEQIALLGRDPQRMLRVNQLRENAAYLPGVPLPENLEVSADPNVLADAGIVVVATPFAGLHQTFAQLGRRSAAVVWAAKGLDAKTGEMAHEMAADLLPGRPVGVLSGPSFAKEVANGLPCALTIASTNATLRQQIVQALHGGPMRVYSSDDVIGVEVGGAVKNVIAIASGVCEGLWYGLNARAALVTRGLAEMARLAVALGGKPETLAGLTGLGDLVLTATGDLSRNRRYGMRLAQGMTPAQLASSGEPLAEGARCAAAVRLRAERLGVDVPITACVADIVAGRLSARQAADRLLARQARDE